MNPKNRKLDKNGNPIVSKKELEDSGLSLRDFLNKERGLTRRGASSKVTKADVAAANETDDPIRTLNKDKNWTRDDTFVRRSAKSGDDMKSDNYVRRDMKAREDVLDREAAGDDKAMKYVPRRDPKPLTEVRKPGTRVTYENEDATNETFKKGGLVGRRGDGCAQRGKTRGRMV